MYRSAMSTRLSRGRSTPEIRATVAPSALPLLVPWVRADDPHLPVPADDLALVAHLLHRRPNLHAPDPPTGSGTRSCRATDRTATAPPAPCPPAGSGCSASASCPRCGPAPCARWRARPETWRWEAAPAPFPRPRWRPSWASSRVTSRIQPRFVSPGASRSRPRSGAAHKYTGGQPPASLSRGQDLVTVLRDRDRVFEVGRERSVLR